MNKIKVAAIAMLICAGACAEAQKSALFTYNGQEVDSVMQKIDESHFVQGVIRANPNDTTLAKAGRVLGAAMIGWLAGDLSSWAGCMIGFRTASSPMDGALIGMIVGGVAALTITPLVVSRMSHDQKRAANTLVGAIIGILPAVASYLILADLVNRWNNAVSNAGCSSALAAIMLTAGRAVR